MLRLSSLPSFAALPLALVFPVALFVACSDSAVGAVTPTEVADAAPLEAATEDATPPPDAAPDAALQSSISGSTKTNLESETHLAVAPDGRVLVAWIGLGPKFGTG